ncbi:histone-fold-containing protein [Cubamyces sp. BRFM 1775]|nr:histone-fold-containing protein [Cubamyces sp. BRFM 1775]
MPKAKEPTASGSMAQAQQDAVADGIENFELPRSVVMKLARASQVPENTKFSKDVILAILKASTVFINYLAATAHEVASSKQHKSISATDVLKALELVEFGDIAKDIQGELQVYRDLQKADKKKGGKGKARDASDSASAVSKSKGKAKASAPADEPQQQPVPTIHIPRQGGPQTAEPPYEVEPEDRGQSEFGDEDQEMMDQDEEGADDVEEDLDEGEDEADEEEPEDTMALEEEELQHDARGLEGDDD